MPTKTKKTTLTAAERKRALRLGIAMIQKEKRAKALLAREKKRDAELNKAAKKVKVEEEGGLYKVTVEGKEYLLDRCGQGCPSVPKKATQAVFTAIANHRKANFSSAATAWLSDKKNTKGINKWAVGYARNMCGFPTTPDDFFDAISVKICDIQGFNPQMWREAQGLDAIRHAIAEDLGIKDYKDVLSKFDNII